MFFDPFGKNNMIDTWQTRVSTLHGKVWLLFRLAAKLCCVICIIESETMKCETISMPWFKENHHCCVIIPSFAYLRLHGITLMNRIMVVITMKLGVFLKENVES